MPSTQWLQSLYRQAPVAIGIYLGPSHRIEFANPRLLEIWDRSLAQVQHIPLFVALPEVSGQGFEEILAKVLTTGEPFSGEELPASLHRNGTLELCYFNILYQPLRDDTGQIIGVTQVATEVTSLVKARQRAQQNEALLQQALSAARMGSWQVDLVAGTAHRSKEFDQIVFGQLQAGVDWQPDRFLSFIYEEDRAAVQAQLQGGLQQGTLEYQARVQWPDGSLHWIEVQGQTSFNLRGKPISITGVIQDITSRKQAQEAEAGRQQELQGLNAQLHSANQQLTVTNQELTAAQRELQAANEELRAANRVIQAANEDLSQAQQALWQLNQELEQRVASRTAELKGAQQEVARQKERLERFFHQAPAGICLLDGAELVFELINPAYQALFHGRQLLGKPVLEALPEIKDTPIESILQQVYQSGETFEGKELLVPLARKEHGPIEALYFNFIYQARYNEEGQVDGILVFVYEVTALVEARKKVEVSEKAAQALAVELALANEELRTANEKIQASNQELSQFNQQLARTNAELNRTNQDLDTFVYTASHDLKAPILNIEGLLKALLRQMGEEFHRKGRVQHIYGLLFDSVNRFKETIRDLTEVARLGKESEEDVSLVSIGELLGEVLLDLEPQVQEANAQLHKRMECSAFHFSRKNLKSILYNLLSNAIKYRSPERVAQIRIRCWQQAGHVVLSVEDNGLGIDMSQEEKLFALFKRLHAHVEGTGIGLYIVKRILDNAGGRIQVESQVGTGSTFTVYFKQ